MITSEAKNGRNPVLVEVKLSDTEFEIFRQLVRDLVGIDFSPVKKPLISGRLAKRLRALGLNSYTQYLNLVRSDEGRDELEQMIDLLTTHETYFFREPRHFDFFADNVLAQWPRNRPLRVWSAASSTGEEPYSIAMVLMDKLGDGADWQVFASDISTAVLGQARRGIYSMNRNDGIPDEYLKKFCLRGIGSQQGNFRIDPIIRRRVDFAQVNLSGPLTAVGTFDLVFLRNVLIYFDLVTKQQIVARIHQQLAANGWLFIGHSESLNGVSSAFRAESPTIYRKP